MRYFYDSWFVGRLGPFEVNSADGTYDFVDGRLVLDNEPTVGGNITVEYKIPRQGDNTRDILVRMEKIADEILSDHLVYDNSGIETNRRIGKIHLNTTDNKIYRWNGSIWLEIQEVISGDMVYIKSENAIYNYDGSSYNILYSVGDIIPSPPSVPYPNNGLGVTWGTYATGQTADAQTDFPSAYQIMQFEGDCD